MPSADSALDCSRSRRGIADFSCGDERLEEGSTRSDSPSPTSFTSCDADCDVDLEHDPPIKKTYLCSSWFRGVWLMLLMSMVVFVLSLAAAIVILRSNQQAKTKSSNPVKVQYSTKALYKARFTTFQTILAPFSNPLEFIQSGTPQSKALQWLVFEDKTIELGNLARLPQRYAVMLLFYSWGGSNWPGYPTPLSQEVHLNECLFRGFKCNAKGELESIDLSFQNLAGEIPEEIGILSQLTSLNLSENSLQGTIPEALFENMQKLESLYLWSNKLAAPISPKIELLTNLRLLHLGDNSISGSIPSTMSQLTNLRELSIAKNQVHGPIFDILAGKWENLTYLNIEATLLTGTFPEDMGRFENLKVLSMHNLGISGTIPSSITRLTALRTFFLSSSRIVGSIPNTLGDLTSLETLSIHGKSLTGTIPTTIGRLSNLNMLVIAQTNLEGTLPTELGLLTALSTKLVLHYSNFSGPLPFELGFLSNLQLLQVEKNMLTGSIPVEVCAAGYTVSRDCTLVCDCCTSRVCEKS